MGWATMWKFIPEALKSNRFSANGNIAIVDSIQRSVAEELREELRSNRAPSTASPVKRKEEQRFARLHKPWLYLSVGKYVAFLENLD
jgi:hypothetical protein